MSQTAFVDRSVPRQTDRRPPGHGADPERVEPRSEAGRRVSEATYWNDYYLGSDIRYEWNNGMLEEKPVSDFETYCVYAWLVRLIETFLRVHPIAKSVGLEMGFRMALPTKVVIRRPDLAVVRNDNPNALLQKDESYQGVYDLCIEALSTSKPAHIHRDTVQKHGEYAAGGVPEYYILHTDPERQAFYSRTPGGLYVPIPPQDGVICSRVLPGFQFRLGDLLSQPADEALRDDPVYAGFVLSDWRADRERAAAAEHRVEQERRRAERLAARLRSMGLDPDDADA
jgi:Uma2 family endonuclease